MERGRERVNNEEKGRERVRSEERRQRVRNKERGRVKDGEHTRKSEKIERLGKGKRK